MEHKEKSKNTDTSTLKTVKLDDKELEGKNRQKSYLLLWKVLRNLLQ